MCLFVVLLAPRDSNPPEPGQINSRSREGMISERILPCRKASEGAEIQGRENITAASIDGEHCRSQKTNIQSPSLDRRKRRMTSRLPAAILGKSDGGMRERWRVECCRTGEGGAVVTLGMGHEGIGSPGCPTVAPGRRKRRRRITNPQALGLIDGEKRRCCALPRASY